MRGPVKLHHVSFNVIWRSCVEKCIRKISKNSYLCVWGHWARIQGQLVLITPNSRSYIQGLPGKYRAYLYISALALFFIIGRVASFKVIPTWLYNTVPAMFPFLETVLELAFRDGLKYAHRIIFNRRFVIESLSFEWFFEF